MMFQLTDVERGRFEDLLYELRYAGYAVDVHYSREDCTVDAVQDFDGKRTTVSVRFTRPGGTRLYVDGRIVAPGGQVTEVTRVSPVITHVRLHFDEHRKAKESGDRLRRHFGAGE